jgi:hypothetical protein
LVALVVLAALIALVALLPHDPEKPLDAHRAHGGNRAETEDLAALSSAQALLDEVNGLTPTEVLLDERARERWLPQLAALQARARDPDAPAAEREALAAVLRRLEELGM